MIESIGDIMNFLVSWSWCSQEGVQNVLHLVKNIISVLRILVPIGLIVMTSIDIFNKVINPEDKEGQNKIMRRLIAAIIVFLIPTIISLAFKTIDKISGNNPSSANPDSGLSSCWD